MYWWLPQARNERLVDHRCAWPKIATQSLPPVLELSLPNCETFSKRPNANQDIDENSPQRLVGLRKTTFGEWNLCSWGFEEAVITGRRSLSQDSHTPTGPEPNDAFGIPANAFEVICGHMTLFDKERIASHSCCCAHIWSCSWDPKREGKDESKVFFRNGVDVVRIEVVEMLSCLWAGFDSSTQRKKGTMGEWKTCNGSLMCSYSTRGF